MAEARESRRLRILVADDNRDTVTTLAFILGEHGHEVHQAFSGADALRAARSSAFDAVILDIAMPDFSGYAIAQELRSAYYSGRLPALIAISGKWTRPSEKVLSHTVGFDHHLTKPCDPNAIVSILAARCATSLRPATGT